MSAVQGFITLAIAFAGTRALGQGALSLAATTAVAVGFDRRRGTAMGITAAVGGSLMSLVPLIATAIIAWVGWRATWVVLGVTVWVVLLPLSRSKVLAVRTIPHHERSPVAVDAEGRAPAAWTRSEVLRTWPFWLVTASVSLSGLVATGLIFHHIALLAERGLTTAEAASNFLPQTVAGAVAAIAAGRLADRVPARALLAASLAGLAVSPLLVLVVGPGLGAVAYAVVLGSSGASLRTVEAAVLPRWYGTTSIGEIRGLVMGATVGATALGPLILATSADRLGSYQPALVAFAVAAAALTVLALATGGPPKARRPAADPPGPGPGPAIASDSQ